MSRFGTWLFLVCGFIIGSYFSVLWLGRPFDWGEVSDVSFGAGAALILRFINARWPS